MVINDFVMVGELGIMIVGGTDNKLFIWIV